MKARFTALSPLSPVRLFQAKPGLRSPVSCRKTDKAEPEKPRIATIPKLNPPPPYSMVVTPPTPRAPPPQTR